MADTTTPTTVPWLAPSNNTPSPVPVIPTKSSSLSETEIARLKAYIQGTGSDSESYRINPLPINQISTNSGGPSKDVQLQQSLDASMGIPTPQTIEKLEEFFGNSSAEATKTKIKELEKAQPKAAKAVRTMLGQEPISKDSDTKKVFQEASETVGAERLNNILKTLFAIETKARAEINNTFSAATSAIDSLSNSIQQKELELKKNFREFIKPVSRVTGSTIANLTHVAQDPLGAVFEIPAGLSHSIGKVSPKLRDSIEVSIKSLKLDRLANLPSQVFGSLESIASILDGVVAIPLQLAEDLYRGLLSIMQSVAKLVDTAVASVADFFFGPDGVLDSIAPGLTDLVDAVRDLTDIAGAFTTSPRLVKLDTALASYSASSIRFDINQFAGEYAYNPKQFLDKLIPTEITEGLEKLSEVRRVTSRGMSGVVDYGLYRALGQTKGQAVTRLLKKHELRQRQIQESLNVKPTNNAPIESQQDKPTTNTYPGTTNDRQVPSPGKLLEPEQPTPSPGGLELPEEPFPKDLPPLPDVLPPLP